MWTKFSLHLNMIWPPTEKSLPLLPLGHDLSPAGEPQLHHSVMEDSEGYLEQPLYCKTAWMLLLFIEGFIWVRVSAFSVITQAALTEGLWMHCFVLALHIALWSRPAFECLTQIWGHRMREKTLPLSAEACGLFCLSKQTNRRHFASLRGQWFPSKGGKSHKGSFKMLLHTIPIRHFIASYWLLISVAT